MKLRELGVQALKAITEELTFNLKDVEVRASKTGNVGYRVKTDQGKVITFWDSTMDEVIVETNATRGDYAVAPGVTVTEDGGLIPKGTQANGFWS